MNFLCKNGSLDEYHNRIIRHWRILSRLIILFIGEGKGLPELNDVKFSNTQHRVPLQMQYYDKRSHSSEILRDNFLLYFTIQISIGLLV